MHSTSMPLKRNKKKKKPKINNRISIRAVDGAWQKLIDDDSGDTYYYNTVTQVLLTGLQFSIPQNEMLSRINL